MTILHAVDTYNKDASNDEDSSFMVLLETGLNLFFIFDYMINLYISENRLLYVFSTNSFIEFVSVLPILLLRMGFTSNNKFIKLTRVLRYLCVKKLTRVLARHNMEGISILF